MPKTAPELTFRPGAIFRRIRQGAEIGIWHETYQVEAGAFECMYSNMPVWGFGKVGELVPATGGWEIDAGWAGKAASDLSESTLP
jgi:hypothetical protein